MSRFRNLLALIFINLLVIAVLLEIGLRLATPALPDSLAIAARWVMSGDPYAETWTPGWQANPDYQYILTPDLDDVLQYGSASVSFRMSTIELWDGGGVGFRTDPVDFFVDAVVVGDSFGMCFTERTDCWVDQLAAQTNQGIVNLSLPVTGTTSHYHILRDFGAPLEPPLVIWQFFGNDFNDDYGLAVANGNLEPIEPNVPPPEANSGNWLQRNSVAIAVIETAFTGRFAGVPDGEQIFVKPHRAIYGEHVLQYGGLYEQEALNMAREVNQIGYDLSREAFINAQQLVESWGGELVVVMIPLREVVYDHLTAATLGTETIEQLASTREAMHTLCTELDLRCFDPLEVFEARALADEALYYTDDMHLNAHGNAVLAAALAGWLSAE